MSSALRPSARSRAVPVSVSAVFVIGVLFSVVCCLLAMWLNVWQDEAYSLHTTSRGVVQSVSQALGFEQQPPLYFILLALWRTLDASPFFARALSILCGVGTILVAERFARSYLREIPSWVVAAIVAFSPFTIWAAVEIRGYALIELWSALLVWLFFRGFLDERPSMGSRVAYVLIAIAALYTQYYEAALLVAGGATLLALRRWRTLGSYVAAMVPALVSLVPLALTIFHQFTAYQGQFEVAAGSTGALAPQHGYTILLSVLDFAFPHGSIESWVHARLANALYGLLVIIACAAIVLSGIRRTNTTKTALLIFCGFAVLFFWLVIDVAHQRVLFPRHTAALFVPTVLAVFALLASVPNPKRSLAPRAYAAIFAVLGAATVWHDYHVPAKSGDWARVAMYLSSHMHAGDAVAVFDAEAALPLQFYFHSPVVSIPRSQSFDNFDEHSFVLHDRQEVAQALRRTGGANRRLWLVLNSVCVRYSAFYGCNALFSYTTTHYSIVTTQAFLGSTVYELEPTQWTASRRSMGDTSSTR